MALGSTDGFPPMWTYVFDDGFIVCYNPAGKEEKKYVSSTSKNFEKFLDSFMSTRCLTIEEIMYEYTRVYFPSY